MATTNPVFQVLVTSGNQAPLAAGSRPDVLADGQIGAFNVHTGLSVDGTVLADCQDIFLAVGRAATGLERSAGQMIQVRHARSFTAKGYVAALPKIVDIAGYVARCETDYALKFELRNGESYRLNGYSGLLKTFTFRTGCCADQCTPCALGDANELAIGLATQINNDPDGLISASYISNLINATVTAGASATASMTVTVGTTVYTVPVVSGNTATLVALAIATAINTTAGSPYRATNAAGVLSIQAVTPVNTPTGTFALTNANGTGVTVGSIVANAKQAVSFAGAAAFLAANPGATLGLRVTTAPTTTPPYFGINLKYEKVRSTDLIVSMIEGFTCNGSSAVVQELQYAEGLGYDIQMEEYEAGGWNGKSGPYRQSVTTGMNRNPIQYNALTAGTYNQLVLTYDMQSVGGWLEYLNNLQTNIAIPCADSTTLSGLITILDLIFANKFGAMASDVTANMDCTNVATHTINSYANDGIESLA